MTTTASRLLDLLSLLQTRRDWPGSLLAARLQVSDRTVRRDVERLREMGYAISATMGPDGGYRLDAGSHLPPLLFDDDQVVAVAIALRNAPAVGAEINEAADRALGTIRQVIPAALRHRLDSLDVTHLPGAGATDSANAAVEVLLALADAIRRRTGLRFDYRSHADTGTAEPTPRRAEPHHLVSSRGRWYLVGWDLDREDWRLYRVDRIHPRVPAGPRFTPRELPGDDVLAFVSARFKGADTNEWPCRGTVVLDLPAHRILPFAGDGTVTPLDDHRCILEAASWSWGALAASFGRFETPLKVIGPPELTSAFATLAARCSAAIATRE